MMTRTSYKTLYNTLYDYFNIGNSYVYVLTRDKNAFNVGTMEFDDFEEFTEEDVRDIVDCVREWDEQVPHENNNIAHWIFLPEKDKTCKKYWWECSHCGKKVGAGLDVLTPTSYCPSCGYEMLKEDY